MGAAVGMDIVWGTHGLRLLVIFMVLAALTAAPVSTHAADRAQAPLEQDNAAVRVVRSVVGVVPPGAEGGGVLP